MQGTQVWSLVQEDSRCHRATEPVHHSYWACSLEPMLHDKRGRLNEKPMHHKWKVTLCAATREKPTQQGPAQPCKQIQTKLTKHILASGILPWFSDYIISLEHSVPFSFSFLASGHFNIGNNYLISWRLMSREKPHLPCSFTCRCLCPLSGEWQTYTKYQKIGTGWCLHGYMMAMTICMKFTQIVTMIGLPWWTLARTPFSQFRGLSSIPDQATRSHKPQQRSKIPCAKIKTWCSQII